MIDSRLLLRLLDGRPKRRANKGLKAQGYRLLGKRRRSSRETDVRIETRTKRHA